MSLSPGGVPILPAARDLESVGKGAGLTVLVDEHAYGDAAHVEAVQEVLDVLAGDRVLSEGVFVLDDALGHGWHHVVVSVPDGLQGLHKPTEGPCC